MSNLDSNPFADPQGANPFAVRENKRNVQPVRAMARMGLLEIWLEWLDD